MVVVNVDLYVGFRIALLWKGGYFFGLCVMFQSIRVIARGKGTEVETFCKVRFYISHVQPLVVYVGVSGCDVVVCKIVNRESGLVY